jgi:hypothetical protein
MRGLRLGVMMVLALVATQAPMPAAAAKRSTQAAFAEPGDIIAAEGNFSHLSAAKGMKVAILATAAPNAQILAPDVMRVTQYADSTTAQLAAQWHTQQLWMSCDGSIAVTHGEWQHGPAKVWPASGWYATIWQRQKGGDYKWVLAESGALKAPLPESDMIAATVADCPVPRARGAAGKSEPAAPDRAKGPAADYLSGHSDDATLEWATMQAADGNRAFVLRLKQDGVLREVLRAASGS